MTRNCPPVELLVALLLLPAAVVWASQSQTAPGDAAPARRFEVASVRPDLSPFELVQQVGRRAAETGGPAASISFGVRTYPGGRFSATSVNVRSLVMHAWDVQEYQVSGGPDWVANDHFAIEARAGSTATEDDMREMLKTLLAERFGLRTHLESREWDAHVLTVARADGRLGPNLKPTSDSCVRELEERKRASAAGATPPPPAAGDAPSRSPDQPPPCGMGYGQGGASWKMAFSGQTIGAFAKQVSSELNAPVIDRTGLTGLYDGTLEYTSERAFAGLPASALPDPIDSSAPPMRLAIERQFGLTLTKERAPIPVVVIDAVTRPAPD